MDDNLVIENFQSYEHAVFPLAKGKINILVGDSRCGKSAMIRALESVALNAPVDRRDGSKLTKVSWKGVSRVRANTENKYEVDGTELKAMRTSVPKQVSDRLRLTDVNFRPQHKAYFLLQDSPGAVARSLNDLADLGLIDHVASKLAAEKRTLDAKLQGLGEQREKLLGQLEALRWAEEADHDVMVAETIQRGIEHTRGELSALSEALRSIEAADKVLAEFVDLDYHKATLTWTWDTASDLVGKHGAMSRLVADLLVLDTAIAKLPGSEVIAEVASGVRAVSVRKELEGIRETLSLLKEYDDDLRDCPEPDADIVKVADVIRGIPVIDSGLGQILRGLEAMPLEPPDVEAAISTVAAVKAAVTGVSVERDSLLLSIVEVEGVERAISLVTAEASDAQNEFNRLLDEAGTCPLCGR